MSGNNKRAEQIIKIEIPLFNQDVFGSTPGLKYYFPEHPEIDKKTIVGIEAHGDSVGFAFDISNAKQQYLTVPLMSILYLSFYNSKNEMVFENIPTVSLLPSKVTGIGNKFKFSIMPFMSKIKTRNCYAQFPANFIPIAQNFYLNLTFYLR